MPLKDEGTQEAVAPELSAALQGEDPELIGERGVTCRGSEKLTDLVADEGPLLMIDLMEPGSEVEVIDLMLTGGETGCPVV